LHAFESVLNQAADVPSVILADALEGCAVAFFRMGDREEAKKYLLRAIQHRPGDADLLEVLQKVNR